MTIAQLRAAYHAQPFQPFILHLADGRQIPVEHREFMMTVPSSRTIVVAEADGALHIINVLLVTDLELRARSNGSRKGRRKR